MDGYMITDDHATALASFENESVRHVAVLDNGQGFVAFEGEHLPCRGNLLLNDADQEGQFAKVRRTGPQVRVRRGVFSDEPETFAIVTMQHFLHLDPIVVRMASVLTNGTVLLVTLPDSIPADSAIWTASAEYFLDKRLLENA
jgi:hypothetical protein